MESRHTAKDAVEVWLGLSSEMLRVRPERCARVRNRHATCTNCIDACTSGAIAIDDGAIRIEAQSCVGCGTCATVCPTGALEVHHPNDASLLSAAKAVARDAGGKATFACQPVAAEFRARGESEGFVEVVCLSRIDEALLLGMFAGGVQSVHAICGECSSCSRACGERSVQLVDETYRALKRAWGLDATYDIECIACSDKAMREVEAAQSNAALAAAGLYGGASCAGEAERETPLAHVTHDGTLPHFVPEKRVKLLDALATFGDPVESVIDSRLWGHILIDENLCQSCRMCAVFCPTGALCKYVDEDGSIGIEHYSAECVHCHLCQDICPAQAIVSSTVVSTKALSEGAVERYPMAEPAWKSGPDQILRRMEKKIGGREVAASYGI